MSTAARIISTDRRVTAQREEKTPVPPVRLLCLPSILGQNVLADFWGLDRAPHPPRPCPNPRGYSRLAQEVLFHNKHFVKMHLKSFIYLLHLYCEPFNLCLLLWVDHFRKMWQPCVISWGSLLLIIKKNFLLFLPSPPPTLFYIWSASIWSSLNMMDLASLDESPFSCAWPGHWPFHEAINTWPCSLCIPRSPKGNLYTFFCYLSKMVFSTVCQEAIV